MNKGDAVKVTFDSNVVEYVVGAKGLRDKEGKLLHDEQTASALETLKSMIEKKLIIPFVSEGYFTIEAIQKSRRREELGKPAKMSSSTKSCDPVSARCTFVMGPSVDVVLPTEFENTHVALRSLGGKVLPVYRLAFPICRDILDCKLDYKTLDKPLDNYTEKEGEISDFIEKEIGSGLEHVRRVLKEDIMSRGIPIGRDNPWYRDLVRNGAINILMKDNQLSDAKLARLVAELADCDMVSSHIAFENDYLCTLDRSRGQGKGGVLSKENLAKLNEKYPIRVVSPTELVEVLNGRGKSLQ